MRDRLYWVLFLVLLALPACPHYEICVESGVCPDVALGPTSSSSRATPDMAAPADTAASVAPAHVHCASKVFCQYIDDAYCCADCGGVCP